eukprot:2716709-Heterocapsa_arctica.AAC.1
MTKKGRARRQARGQVTHRRSRVHLSRKLLNEREDRGRGSLQDEAEVARFGRKTLMEERSYHIQSRSSSP